MLRLVGIVTVCVGFVFPTRALAQQDAPTAGTVRPERPYGGLFGGGVGDTGHSLTAAGTIGSVGYRLLSGISEDALLPADLRRQSWASRATGTLRYSVSRAIWTLDASAGSSALDLTGPAFPSDTIVETYTATIRSSWRLGRGTSFRVGQDVGYRPVYLIGVLSAFGTAYTDPGLVLATGGGASADQYLTLASRAELSHTVSRRVSAYASYERRSSRAPSFVFDLDGYDARAGVRLSVTKSFGLRLGYGYADSKFGTAEEPRHLEGQSFDTSLDFNRPLSLTRRTTLKFNAGVSAVRDRTRNQRYVLIGGATLTREIGRSWTASAGYGRDTQFIEAFEGVFVSDRATASLTGLIARRLQLDVQATWSLGTFGFDLEDTGSTRRDATTSLVYGITRYLGLGASYSYFQRSYERGVALPAGFAPNTDSQSVQAYMTLWAPLYQRARRPNAAR